MPEIIKLRNWVLAYEGFDFFGSATTISSAWLRQANQEYQRVLRQEEDASIERDTDEP